MAMLNNQRVNIVQLRSSHIFPTKPIATAPLWVSATAGHDGSRARWRGAWPAPPAPPWGMPRRWPWWQVSAVTKLGMISIISYEVQPLVTIGHWPKMTNVFLTHGSWVIIGYIALKMSQKDEKRLREFKLLWITIHWRHPHLMIARLVELEKTLLETIHQKPWLIAFQGITTWGLETKSMKPWDHWWQKHNVKPCRFGGYIMVRSEIPEDRYRYIYIYIHIYIASIVTCSRLHQRLLVASASIAPDRPPKNSYGYMI